MRYRELVDVLSFQQTQNICTTFVQRRPNVFDVGPTLYKCYTNVLCLLGYLFVFFSEVNHDSGIQALQKCDIIHSFSHDSQQRTIEQGLPKDGKVYV